MFSYRWSSCILVDEVPSKSPHLDSARTQMGYNYPSLIGHDWLRVVSVTRKINSNKRREAYEIRRKWFPYKKAA